ncbi:CLUMA_CG009333, isoform A [Clunio marinus]|uniref:CLUMA_CG009333, isoform A n=1 Tax=Clunio marinus TaxID=568069 RepID=A0A1J1I6E0_9DIPT|nr:CLUMA_CG009333, isoform A [Clunio marinus]
MFKFITVLIFSIIGLVLSKPNPQVIVSPAVGVVSPYVVSTSSQYVARNFNGLSAAYVAEAPVVSAYSAYSAYPYVF